MTNIDSAARDTLRQTMEITRRQLEDDRRNNDADHFLNWLEEKWLAVITSTDGSLRFVLTTGAPHIELIVGGGPDRLEGSWGREELTLLVWDDHSESHEKFTAVNEGFENIWFYTTLAALRNHPGAAKASLPEA